MIDNYTNLSFESDSNAVDASVDTFSVKDVISVTDDNLKAVKKSTAKTIASNNEKTSPTCSTPTLKRNLIDVYDVDDPLTQSTTKSHSVATVGGEQNVGTSRRPFRDITNGNIVGISNAQHTRKVQKLNLDNKKRKGLSPSSCIQPPTPRQSPAYVKHINKSFQFDVSVSQDNRRSRKTLMDIKRGRNISTTSNIQSSSTSQSYQTTYESNQQPQVFAVDIFSGVSKGKIDTAINQGKGPFVFRLSGQNYHSIGSLQPEPGCKAKFSQLYIYDTDNELTNRQKIFGDSKNMSTEAAKAMDLQIIQRLKEMLDSQNVLVKTYRMARDSLQENPHIDLKLRLIANRQKDGRTYNLPTTSEVAALIVGDISDSLQPRDILVTTMGGKIIPISELHPSYVPLQYPIIFINGEDGYRVDIYHRGVNEGDDSKRPFTTMREWFAFRIQDRLNHFSILLNSRRLLQ
ncbi:uncharacterized protein LOC143553626 [Bidens hawaiensis]|uniref:uncharacterized protein LOC143553626 n=1 Tax=Bidens hawaiensis TaxID=980011 RepID=UPI00404B73E0